MKWRSLVAVCYVGAVLLLFFASAAAIDMPDCGYSDTISLPAPPSPSTTPHALRGITVWARDNHVSATAVPTWAYSIWDTTKERNIPDYFDNVSYGLFEMQGENVFANDSEYFVAPTTTCLVRDDIRYRRAAYVQFYDSIMKQVDAVVDFSEFDLYGSGGTPDNYVDFVDFLVAGCSGPGITVPWVPGYTTKDTSAAGDTIRIREYNWGMGYFWIDANSHQGFMTTYAHEWLHTLGGLGDRKYNGHPALGSFDPLTTAGFNQWPSPYTPVDQETVGWNAIRALDENDFQTPLLDRMTDTGRVVALWPTATLANQHFVVSFHDRSNLWESSWPSRGVMIWHTTPAASTPGGWSGYWHPIKIEVGSGLYDWIDSVTIDTTSPDPELGEDSLDTWFVWPTGGQYGLYDVGSANMFWGSSSSTTPYRTFDELTNPSSRIHRNVSQYPQDSNSHVAVRHIQLSSNEDTAYADLLTQVWTGAIANSVTWSGPSVAITGDITIDSGVTLTIDSGTTIWVMSSEDNQATGDGNRVEIFVDGTLNAVGTSTAPVVFRSHNGDSLAWRGVIVNPGGKASIRHCEFNDMSHGIRVIGADSVTIDSCEFDNIGYIAISVEAADDSITPSGTVISNCTLQNGALASSCGIVIDSNATASMSGIVISAVPLGIVFSGGWGNVDDAFIVSADTGVIVNAGDSTVSLYDVDVFGTGTLKGVRAMSGVVKMNQCDIAALAYSGIDAYSGTAEIWLDSSAVSGHPTSSAAVTIGPNARISARNTVVEDSWIGFEINGNGLDSLMWCHAINNTLTGVRWNGTGPDYMFGNYVTNDSATASNFGVNVYRQSIISQKDTVKAGYNWNFNFYSAITSNLTADIDELRIVGRDGAQWGLVLNGPSSTNDIAYVDDSNVDSVFTGAHLYIRWLSAQVVKCEFVSTGDTITASPIGIKDMGGPSTGFVRCSDVLNQRTELVQRASTSSINYGDPAAAEYGENSIYVTSPSSMPGTVYFKNLGTSSIKAEHNYWGTSDSSAIAARISGPLDFSPYRSSTPTCVGQPPDWKIAAEEPTLPTEFSLEQNYPNPFNPTTTIRFALPIEQQVRLDLYNVLGQQVRSFDLGLTPTGYRSVFWNGRNDAGRTVGSGIYFYRLWTPVFTETKKMLLLK